MNPEQHSEKKQAFMVTFVLVIILIVLLLYEWHVQQVRSLENQETTQLISEPTLRDLLEPISSTTSP